MQVVVALVIIWILFVVLSWLLHAAKLLAVSYTHLTLPTTPYV